ncbi:hypothetical protein BCV69DRAFT_12410 [Microstroma glucosiphilum]|uniref:Uncharacterized protein n=1 Tax=Pseudomicrostroma glucosiphilum TaxID=1684307 RepID=A0A316UF41_9BASI|nr:hypothetical protein BCV69DRAFT_12410 [Pseudomicrostroma glucosiphilum]PWN23862.1 hypothetical protein BCV69DRAFT_12410 [Pseudomicrostroma glucosiphilum]
MPACHALHSDFARTASSYLLLHHFEVHTHTRTSQLNIGFLFSLCSLSLSLAHNQRPRIPKNSPTSFFSTLFKGFGPSIFNFRLQSSFLLAHHYHHYHLYHHHHSHHHHHHQQYEAAPFFPPLSPSLHHLIILFS